jgi:hypothetical protein
MKKRIRTIDFSGIEKAIVSVKGQNVIIDSDVAKIYGVETREVNQAIKNNPDKFPAGYIIEADKDELIKTFDKFKNIKNYPGTPKAFTEKGLYMLATILRSPQATAATIAIIDEMKFRHTVKREKKKETVQNAKKPINGPNRGDFTVLGKGSFLAVKISLKRGCFGGGWEGKIGVFG